MPTSTHPQGGGDHLYPRTCRPIFFAGALGGDREGWIRYIYISGWWFETFFIFPNSWDDYPI